VLRDGLQPEHSVLSLLVPYFTMLSSAIVVIDVASPEHPYLQLVDRLREQIQAGDIVSRLPSLTELTSQTGLAVGTVRRAIDILAREQLVRTVPGRGTFVITAQR
jgi:GntR family transcriptional regulator